MSKSETKIPSQKSNEVKAERWRFLIIFKRDLNTLLMAKVPHIVDAFEK